MGVKKAYRIGKQDASKVLIPALKAILRCPGIGQTDQKTGKTFYAIVRAALSDA